MTDASIEPNPAALQRVLQEAASLEIAGDRAGALRVLDEADEGLRGFGSYHYARGAMLVRQGDLDEGVAALARALEIEPDVPEVRANLGAAHLERVHRRGPQAVTSPESQADLREALSLLEEAARQKPRLPDVHGNLGRALTLAGRPVEALAAFDRALGVEPRHVPTLYNKAAALHALGRDEDALAVLDALLAIAPGFPPAVKSRESALRRLGR